MREWFKKIPFQLRKPLIQQIKILFSLNAIGFNCYMKKINEKLPTLKKKT